MRIFVSNKTTKYKTMKSVNEVRQEIIRIQGILLSLYSELNGAVYPETLNESIKRYETNLQALKWVLNE